MGQVYGNHYTWDLPHGSGPYIDSLGVSQLEIWKNFFSSLPWQDLVPDQQHTTLTDGFGTFGSDQILLDSSTLATNDPVRVSQSDFATAARTADGSYVVVYMPTARTVTVNMSSLKGPATARWFDPTNGTYHAVRVCDFSTKEPSN